MLTLYVDSLDPATLASFQRLLGDGLALRPLDEGTVEVVQDGQAVARLERRPRAYQEALTVPEAAQFAGVADSTIRHACRTGRLAHRKGSGKALITDRQAVRALQARGGLIPRRRRGKR